MTTKKETFLERLERHVLIGDGAMGTMLYQMGAFINTCFDELNLTRSNLVRKVHEAYIDAGVDFIETNTFGANQYKLSKFGLVDQVEAINLAGGELARQAAEDHGVLVGGSIGPLGPHMQPYGKLTEDQVREAFIRQIRGLMDGQVDFLIFETFSNPDELLIAVETAASLYDIPIVAQITTNEFKETIFGQKLEDAFMRIAGHPAVNVAGLNCSIGPGSMLSSLEIIRSATDKPVSVQPNAGMPREVEGRKIYMCTPEYMAEYSKRFFEKGARIIGGCCGSTPEHISEIAKVIHPLDKAMRQIPDTNTASISVKEVEMPAAQETIPLEKRSKWAQKLVAGEKVASIEITPPRGAVISNIVEKAKFCSDHGVDAINIPDGPRASSRMSPMVTAIHVNQHVDIEVILHVCCRDRNIIGLQADMLGCEAMGLKNMLIVTGDPPKLGEYPDATAVFDLDAIGLTQVCKNLNQGIDLGLNSFTPPLSMVLGVGANPVAADLPREIDRFKRKVEAGAEFAITQPVFDPDMLIHFMEETKNHKIPIVAGIWPLVSYKNAEFMANEVPGVLVPEKILEKMSKAQTKEEGRLIGIEIAREMIEKIKDHVAGYAVSAPFGNVNIALGVLGKISPEEACSPKK